MEHKTVAVTSFKAGGEGKPEGSFEALVSVFNNVDSGGDRVLPGAFTNTLKQWQESGDPIPVLFAHEWNDLDAHIGEVLEAEETEEGLRVKAQLEMDEPFAARVWKKLKRRTLKQFSFSYDVVRSKMVDGVRELAEVVLYEVGPCFLGMNPATQLLGVKAEGKPYPNEHACRLVDPDKFVRCIRKEVEDTNEVDGYEPTGKPYDLIICYTEDGKSEVQAHRYKKDVWTEEQARKHCRAHGGSFEAASGEESAACLACQKVGARHTGKEYEQIQAIHDHAVALGAKCSEGGDEDTAEDQNEAGDGKSRSPSAETLRLRVESELLDI